MSSSRVRIDETLCVNSGNCAYAVPDVFGQRASDGVGFPLADSFDDSLRRVVEEAVDMCPGGAIFIVDE